MTVQGLPNEVRKPPLIGRWAQLAALSLLIALVSPCALARSVALLIGNADYTHERKLRNPVNDAELLGGVLKTSLKFDDVRIERNLGVAAMDRSISAFVERAKGADTVVFYYSGHGMKKSANDRRNFLLPVDARTGTGDALDLERQAVSAESVRDRLKGLGARVTLLVLDACREGPGGGARSGNKGLSRNGGGNQLLVAYATEEDQVAEDGAGRNSTYAAALAQALQRPEPLLAQLDWVADEVQRQVPGQVPTRDGNLRHNAYLVPSPFAPDTPANRAAVEDEAWALCRAASNTVPCDDYLTGWPKGRYASLARTRLRELQAAAARPAPAVPASVTQLPPQQGLASPGLPPPGTAFRDCADCPEMVIVPTGEFLMGSPASEAGRDDDEGPQRRVRVQRFALGRTEVTVAQWRHFVQASAYVTDAERNVVGQGCYAWDASDGKWDWRAGRSWRSPGWEQKDSEPVVCVSWNDAQAYTRWLNERSGVKGWRLPSEAEWEYAARAGSTTSRPWGDDPNQACTHANGADQTQGPQGNAWTQKHECRDGYWFTAPVASFRANAWGLYDMLGNAWEWVQDCFGPYSQASTDGSAKDSANCSLRVLRGGGWVDFPQWLRSAIRFRNSPDIRGISTGLRLARTVS